MKLLICNERFLFRFGLDRVLILMGQGMAERGHEVYLMGCRCDEDIVASFAKAFIAVPPAPDDYANSNEFTAQWLEAHWGELFAEAGSPDVVIIGGWPFFQAIDVFSRRCPAVVFIDPGAVPIDGFVGHALYIQQKLREFRHHYLKQVTAILPISEFIATSQSIPDRGSPAGVHTVLLGADHMDMDLWQAQMVGQSAQSRAGLSLLEKLTKAGRAGILNLGRWEPNCYKNSDACFEIMRQVIRQHPEAVLLVLAERSTIEIPADLKGYVEPIGFPDDAELQEIMKRVTLGISVSLWEGFNLPLAEMQWLQQPALAFNLAAHPEVVVHPWFLCADVADMVQKIGCVLSGQIPADAAAPAHYGRFRSRFRWDAVVQTYCNRLETALQSAKFNRTVHPENAPLLVIDVTNSSRDPANSGVIRVTRQLCRSLQSSYDPVFVVWDFAAQRYTLPSQTGYWQLSQFNGPDMPPYAQSVLDRSGTSSLDEFLAAEPSVRGRLPLRGTAKQSVILFLAETVLDPRAPQALAYAKQRQWKTAAILYDLIPVLYPEFCSGSVSSMFAPYLEMLAGVDTVIPISKFSADCGLEYWRRSDSKHGDVKAVLLPGEFGQHPRNRQKPDVQAEPVHFLCVSTLEPRKNHRNLLQACEILTAKHPDLNWCLTLVGNRYDGAPEIYQAVQSACDSNPRIRWLGVVDDATLHQLYEKSTFTIYSSLIEGFGMPILESIWHGRVCLCHSQGVMAELAADGGCMTVDMGDPQAIAQAIYTLSSDRTRLTELSQAAIDRKLKTWDEYAGEVLSILGLEKMNSATMSRSSTLSLKSDNWQDLLYPNCLTDHWQMTDSERMGLTGVLARHRPGCSIEVGTYYGGSLSLLSQYSDMVFSIDIDPEVLARVPAMDNVSFLTGSSTVLLPALFQALDEADIPIDFVLIDGDHSSDGVRRDIEIVLSYVPKRPLFIMMHDSFNPGCRQGITSANWQASPHVAWVEVDFIPGRIIEGEESNPFRGQMWGGLALALLSPTPRQGDLAILTSAQSSYELALNTRP